jgi:hypothetical protein
MAVTALQTLRPACLQTPATRLSMSRSSTADYGTTQHPMDNPHPWDISRRRRALLPRVCQRRRQNAPRIVEAACTVRSFVVSVAAQQRRL